MKIIDFRELKSTKFSLHDISVIYQSPTWNILGNDKHKRTLNGFLLIDNGECKYEWDGGEANLQKGSLIYLPTSCRRIVTVTKRPFSFYRISFFMTDADDGELIIFSENPWYTYHSMGESSFDLCKSMQESTMSENNMFLSMSLLCNFFQKIEKTQKRDCNKRILKVIDYIDNCYTENTDSQALADMCYLSKTQMFRLFKKETGYTPVDYRNKLRIKKAQQLLLDGESTMGEISEMLGFENVYYFSRIFKKYVGIPPSRYE